MKRLILCLALGAGLLGGCSASQTTTTIAGLSGTYDLEAAGDFIFVTSADRNELRVLELNASPRNWRRAPNPLEPLAIPVLERPIYLTRDVRYDAQGNEVTGGDKANNVPFPYIYARSAGTEEISVVSADPDILKEVKRLSGLGFVTAFAARGADKEEDPRILYYATQDETGSRLFRLELPGPEALLASGSAPLVGTELPLAAPLKDEAVTALLMLRSTTAGQERLVVATRKTTSTAALGDRTFRLDMTTQLDTNTGKKVTTVTGSVEYKFGGPVRLLATHPRVANLNHDAGQCDLDDSLPPGVTQPEAIVPLDANKYVFGVLDESVCTTADQESCSGILAVDAETGEVPNDSTQARMLPIRVGQALPTGLTLAADANVLLRCKGGSAVQRLPLIGIAPSSDGRINIFDAAKLRSFDLNVETVNASTGEVLTTGLPGQSGTSIVDVNGAAKSVSRLNSDGTPNYASYIILRVEEGATRDETYRAVYQGALQGLVTRPLPENACTDQGCSLPVDASAVEARSGGGLPMLRVNDLVSIYDAAGTECSQTLTVTATAVQTQPDGQKSGLITTTPLPGECQSSIRFTVRAGTQNPLVVYSDIQGYLGRMAVEDGELPIPGGYYFHSPDPEQGNRFVEDAAFQKYSAYFKLEHIGEEFKNDKGEVLLARGDQFVATAESGLQPFSAAVDTASSTAGLTAFRLPGPVVHTKVGDVDFAYIAYPSADGILQVSLAGLVDNVANIRGLVPFQ